MNLKEIIDRNNRIYERVKNSLDNTGYKTIDEILFNKKLSHTRQAVAMTVYISATERYENMPMSITENETKEQYAMYFANKYLNTGEE